MDSLLLKVSLDALLQERNIEESVQTVAGALSEYFDMLDQKRLHEALQSEDVIDRVGLYLLQERMEGRKRVIEFTHPEKGAILFYFQRVRAPVETSLSAGLKGKAGIVAATEVYRHHVAEAVNNYHNPFRGSNYLHPNEILLGRNASTLEVYALERVDVRKDAPRVFTFFRREFSIPRTQTRTIYIDPNE